MAVRIERARIAGLRGERVRGWANKAAASLGRENDDLAIVFTDAKKIKKLNREYRKRDEPTDVLSFPAGEKGDMGDIFICTSIARKKAVARGDDHESYLKLLVVHSVLHLGGYDHHTEKESAAMAKMEKRILKGIRD